MTVLFQVEALVQITPLLAANDVALAVGSAAQAGMVRVTIDVKAVVERELNAWLDILQGMDDDFATDDPSLAIWIARMIDEAGRVPREIPINVIALREREDIHCGIASLDRFRVLPGAPALAFSLVDALTQILDDRRILGNEAGGIHPAAVNRRSPHFTKMALTALPQSQQLAIQDLLFRPGFHFFRLVEYLNGHQQPCALGWVAIPGLTAM